MQKKLLKSAYSSLHAAQDVLETVKSADIKARKLAKASAKSKWSKRIDTTTDCIKLVQYTKNLVRHLPRRVA